MRKFWEFYVLLRTYSYVFVVQTTLDMPVCVDLYSPESISCVFVWNFSVDLYLSLSRGIYVEISGIWSQRGNCHAVKLCTTLLLYGFPFGPASFLR